MTPTGKYKAVCRICNQPVAEFPMLEIPIIGDPSAKAKKVLLMLTTHLMTQHAEQAQAGMRLIQDFQAFLILSQFATDDPSIQARAETVRAGLQAISRKFTLSDQQIQNAIVQMDSAGQFNVDTMQQFVREIRDVLTESGAHAPKIETPPAVVLA